MTASDRLPRTGRLWVDSDLATPDVIALQAGTAVAFTCGLEAGANQDALVITELPEGGALLAVADGAGGLPSGAAASAIGVRSLATAAAAHTDAGDGLRPAILSAFDQANLEIQALGVGAGSTLSVAEIDSSGVRSYHAGDSVVLITGQRGRVKLLTMAHSPVGYAQEAGVLTEREALRHDERHLVSNLLGTAGMRIEMGPVVPLAAHDTLVLGSDGLFDNLTVGEIVQLVRTGPLQEAAGKLAAEVHKRMQSEASGRPCKPDDVGFILFRAQPAQNKTGRKRKSRAAGPVQPPASPDP